MVAALGRPREPLLVDCREAAVELAALPAEAAVVVVNSGVRRSLSDGPYAERRAAWTRGGADRRVVASRRDARRGADDPVARHVVTENERVERMVGALRAGNLEDAGGSHGWPPQPARRLRRLDARARCARGEAARLGVACARLTGGGSAALCDRARARDRVPTSTAWCASADSAWKNGVRPQFFRPDGSAPCAWAGSIAGASRVPRNLAGVHIGAAGILAPTPWPGLCCRSALPWWPG